MVLASTALETATAELAPKLAIRAEAAMVRTMSLRMASLPWAVYRAIADRTLVTRVTVKLKSLIKLQNWLQKLHPCGDETQQHP